jgi:Acyltransferase
MNTVYVNNRQVLIEAIESRPPDVPLITVANHTSCFDDPGLWGVLLNSHLFFYPWLFYYFSLF